MNRKLDFAIIGCGMIAPRHATHIQRLGNLRAVCDTDAGKANEFAERFSCTAYTNLDELLSAESALDVISICTPNSLHADQTVRALQAGFHVLCEKPMAIDVRDCEKMIFAAEKANKRLFVVKQNRYNPPVAALKTAIDEGKLGSIINVQVNCFWNRNPSYYLNSDWKGRVALDGGVLFTQFSHFVDLVYWLVGDVKHAYAVTRNFAHHDTVEFEDTGIAVLEFYSGALGSINFTINSFNKNMEGSLTIFGEKGTVKIGGQYLNTLEYQNIENFEITVSEASNSANEYGYYQGSMSNHDKVYKNLIDALNNNASQTIHAIEGMKIVQIIEKLYAAGRRVSSTGQQSDERVVHVIETAI
jgi:predicted dehydrogenase